MQDYAYTDFEIIDAHTHIYPPKIAVKAAESIGTFYGLPAAHEGSTETLLAEGARYGVSKYLVCSVATAPEQVSSINCFIAKECEEHGEFLGFGTLHPKMDGVEQEVDRIIKMGLRGIKLHPDFQLFDLDSPEAYRIYEIAEGRLPFLMHMGDPRYDRSSPERLKKALDDFPRLEVIAAHFGGYTRWESARSILRRDNVKVDTSSSLFALDKEYVKKLINHYGVENCFFGTDFPLWNYGGEVEAFFRLDLPYGTMEKLLGGNFREYFKI